MANPVIVNNSTSLVLIDSQQIAPGSFALVLMSSVQYTGTVITVRDITGFCSSNTPIIISTTSGLTFQDGSFSTLITQPFGYFSFNSFQAGIWTILNNFAFPDQNRSAFVRNITTDTITVGTQNVASMAIQEISSSRIFVNSLLSSSGSTILNTTWIKENLNVLSSISANIQMVTPRLIVENAAALNALSVTTTTVLTGSTLQYAPLTVFTPSLFQSSLTIGDSMSTVGPVQFLDGLSVQKSLVVGSFLNVSTIPTALTLQSTTTFLDSTRLLSNLSVQANAKFFADVQIAASTTISSILTVRDEATFLSSVSTHGFFSQLGPAYFSDIVTFNQPITVNALQNLTVFSSATFYSSAVISTNLVVNQSTFLGGAEFLAGSLFVGGAISSANALTIAGPTVLANSLSALSTVNIQSTLSVGSSAIIGSNLLVLQNLSVARATVLTGGFSSLSTAVITGALYATQAPSFFSTTSTIGNQTTTGFTTLSSFSSIGSGVITGNLLVAGNLVVNQVQPVSANMVFDKAMVLKDSGPGFWPINTNGYYFQNTASTTYIGYSTLAQPTLTVFSNALGVMRSTVSRTLDVQGDFRAGNVDGTQSLLFAQDSVSQTRLRLQAAGISILETARGADPWSFRAISYSGNSTILSTQTTQITMFGNSLGLNTAAPDPTFSVTMPSARITGNLLVNGTATLQGSLSLASLAGTTMTGNLNMFNNQIISNANINTTTASISTLTVSSISGATTNFQSAVGLYNSLYMNGTTIWMNFGNIQNVGYIGANEIWSFNLSTNNNLSVTNQLTAGTARITTISSYTMTGAIAMGNNGITGVNGITGTGTLTMSRVNAPTHDAFTMAGNIAMAANSITGVNAITGTGTLTMGRVNAPTHDAFTMAGAITMGNNNITGANQITASQFNGALSGNATSATSATSAESATTAGTANALNAANTYTVNNLTVTGSLTANVAFKLQVVNL